MPALSSRALPFVDHGVEMFERLHYCTSAEALGRGSGEQTGRIYPAGLDFRRGENRTPPWNA